MKRGLVAKALDRIWWLVTREFVKRHHYDASLVSFLSNTYGIPDVDFYYDQQFFLDRSSFATVESADVVVDVVLEQFSPTTVVDLGCGNGSYVRAFQRRGIHAWGVEGSRGALTAALVDLNDIRIFDLREALRFDKRADLCLCFEVLEHIDKRHAEQVVANIANAAPELLVTAATPDQGGRFHINEQPHAYWIARFRARGFNFDGDTTALLRRRLAEKDALWWLADNMMAFRSCHWEERRFEEG